VRARAGLAAALALIAMGVPAGGQEMAPRPGREVSLPPSEVKDTFFAWILGVIGIGAEIEIDNAEMRAILLEFKSTIDVPFDLISRVSQRADPQTAERRIELEFLRDVVIPVPFSLLFYHPGSIIATQFVSFDVHRSSWTESGAENDTALAEVYDLELTEGSILVDIDDWLEALLSASLEDTWIRHIVLFRWHRDWIGILQGIGRSTSRVLRAYFDFTENRIMFPVPESLDRAGRKLVPAAPAVRDAPGP
jgi:hypothetical protein